MRLVAACWAAALVAVTLVGSAEASYAIAGGTPREQAQVRAALEVSTFDWGVLPPVAVRIVRGAPSSAAPGDIVLDANLLDAGRFSWGVVLHEFAHELDFLLLDDAERAELASLLGGGSWWASPGLGHDDLTSERFASALAWASWPARDNVMGPAPMIPGFGELVEGLVASHQLYSDSLR